MYFLSDVSTFRYCLIEIFVLLYYGMLSQIQFQWWSTSRNFRFVGFLCSVGCIGSYWSKAHDRVGCATACFWALLPLILKIYILHNQRTALFAIGFYFVHKQFPVTEAAFSRLTAFSVYCFRNWPSNFNKFYTQHHFAALYASSPSFLNIFCSEMDFARHCKAHSVQCYIKNIEHQIWLYWKCTVEDSY